MSTRVTDDVNYLKPCIGGTQSVVEDNVSAHVRLEDVCLNGVAFGLQGHAHSLEGICSCIGHVQHVHLQEHVLVLSKAIQLERLTLYGTMHTIADDGTTAADRYTVHTAGLVGIVVPILLESGEHELVLPVVEEDGITHRIEGLTVLGVIYLQFFGSARDVGIRHHFLSVPFFLLSVEDLRHLDLHR